MRLKIIDTYGVLDRCSYCGERASIIKINDGWVVECSECSNCVPMYENKSEATTTWNKEQRAAIASRNNEKEKG